MDRADRPTRVLFIAAAGRSGSTLLERMLGQVPGCCSVGELVHLWERGVAGDERCGCGLTFHACPFWSEVGTRAFGGWDALGSRVLDLKRRVDRHRYVPLMLAPPVSRTYAVDLRRFSEFLVRLYRAVSDVSGAEVVVDSSKSSSYLVLLRRLRDVDLRVVHLVRDARGVAYSATKRVRRPEVVRAVAYMPTLHPARSAAEWDAYNLVFGAVRTSRVPSLRLRYEDLLRDPRDGLRRVLELAGLPGSDLAFVGDSTVSLGITHTISGNPMRFESGAVPFRLDEEWRTRLPRRHRVLVSALTWPLMRRYGYDLRH